MTASLAWSLRDLVRSLSFIRAIIYTRSTWSKSRDLPSVRTAPRSVRTACQDPGPISAIIIPLLCHFTILGLENAQNVTRYYIVEQGKNTDGKRSTKMAGQNVPNFDLFTSLLVE